MKEAARTTDPYSFLLEHSVITLGKFKLKSGRESPYFFNASRFSNGHLLKFLASLYAQQVAILCRVHNEKVDVIFGPAYKGISLAVAVAMELGAEWSANRKESKDHGEGGVNLGADMLGKNVLIVDDVITSGISIHEAHDFVIKNGGKVVGVVVAFDRMERGLDSAKSAAYEVVEKYGIPIYAPLNVENLKNYLQSISQPGDIHQQVVNDINNYLKNYGAL
jgi:orotate phosphoribosyltransferase